MKLNAHHKLLALGIGVLVIILAWPLWPQGDLPRVEKLIRQERYADALQLLDEMQREQPSRVDYKILRAKALVSLDRLNEAELLLSHLASPAAVKYYREIRDISAQYALKRGEREEWAQAANGWRMAIHAQGWHDWRAWSPPQAWHRHLALGVIFELEEVQRLHSVRAGLSRDLTLSRLALAIIQLSWLEELDVSGLIRFQEELAELALVDWNSFGMEVAQRAEEMLLLGQGQVHLRLVAAEALEPGEGLSPQVADTVLAATWPELASVFSARNRNQEYFKQVLVSLHEVFPPDHPLNPAARLWLAVLTGQLEIEDSQVLAFLNGVDPSLELVSEGQWYYEPRVPRALISGDQAFFGVETQDRSWSWGTMTIFSFDSPLSIGQVSNSTSNYWSPEGHLLLDGSMRRVHRDPANLDEFTQLPWGFGPAGWWSEDSLYTKLGEVYDLEGNRIGTINPLGYEVISASGKGMALIRDGSHGYLAGPDGHVLTRFRISETRTFLWSPEGRQLVIPATQQLVTATGNSKLKLPPGSTPQGWLDEDRLLVRQSLGPKTGWYIYSLSNQDCAYIRMEEDAVILAPVGGEAVLWQQDRQIHLGKLR